MKIDESKLLIFIISIILGFLLSSKIFYGTTSEHFILSYKNYNEMNYEINKIKEEISILKITKNKLYKDLVNYKTNDTDDEKIISNLTDQINKIDIESGLTDLSGPGIIITLSDSNKAGSINILPGTESFYIVHDTNLLFLVNELKNAGAEAISINGQRVTSNTAFTCAGPSIKINDWVYTCPFIIKVIGDPDALAFKLNSDDSYYRELEKRELRISFTKTNSIVIPRYDQSLRNTYIKPSE